ncbi:hypothetical protein EK21DRAFT_74485 [Setomelanomma holmii]|uniref:Uncharacterized protein n=1 Tax=Setomelanomma holmii TaxID=210430 RepID=A0A9P4H0T0_9PLEO|nr:hypothetical protein EK21DRAFT_74485 [Setomelanomma holmii]
MPEYPHLESSNPNYYDFTLNTSTIPSVEADTTYFEAGNMQYKQWTGRAKRIRDAGSPEYCSGNLSVALAGVGEAYRASASGSTSLLTLLPTAGALIGAPAKELWVLYKLVPLAGFLSSVLSLGGSIVPHQVSDYASLEDFSYNDMPNNNATDGMLRRRVSGKTWSDQFELDVQQIAEHFADQVYARAMDLRGSSKTWKIGLGICGLIVCVLLICGACYMLSAGSIVVWWCEAENWAFTWYSITIFSSVFENYANTPFAKDWVMRISRAPHLRISTDAPWSLLSDQTTAQPVIDALKKGYNTESRVIMEHNVPWSASKDAFYVIISRGGVRRGHTILRLVSKSVSVAAFVVSTALFASSTLLQFQPAILVMALVLSAGIFGRVTAMWISAVIMRDRPVLHRIVKTKKEASVFMEAILRREGMVCEVLGHVIVNGRCVKRRSKLTWSTIFGVLAKPFDVSSIAVVSSA